MLIAARPGSVLPSSPNEKRADPSTRPRPSFESFISRASLLPLPSGRLKDIVVLLVWRRGSVLRNIPTVHPESSVHLLPFLICCRVSSDAVFRVLEHPSQSFWVARLGEFGCRSAG